MATTEIHAITSTPNKAVNYIISDKVVLYNSDDKINKEATYRLIEKNGAKYILYSTLNSYQNCNMLDPYSTFKDIQEKWQNVRYKNYGKKAKNNKEPLMWHLHQSFNGLEVTPEIANEIGRKLSEEIFKGFPVIISTHCNTENIHNHFVISAWNNEGKKWNDCLKTKRQIRNVSDNLCKEYGLSVLEHTRDMKLISYKDKDGVTRYYEPTDRKNELIKKRNSKKITTDDVKSYRNTLSYEKTEKKKMDNREEIKADIDIILANCRNYDELLERLREVGYFIRDKKKNGEWLKHISFQAPTHNKATREDKIGDGKFYVRKNLEKYIAEQVKAQETQKNDEKVIPYFEAYEYGEIDLNEVNDNYKTICKNGEYKTVERTDLEKKVLSNIRVKNSKLKNLINTAQLEKVIAEQKREKKPYLSRTEEQRLIADIQNNFRCLQYTEKHNLYSYKQIIDLYRVSKSKYEATISNFNKAEKAIGQLKDILETPKKLSDLLNKIESKKKDVTYILDLEEYRKDKKMVENYKSIIAKYKIDTQKGFKILEIKVNEFESKQNVNRKYMTNIITKMEELEHCIKTFDRIDIQNGKRDQKSMEEFEKIARSKEEKQREYKKERER